MHIIDRRLNPKGKSLENRQRFLERSKEAIQEAVFKAIGSRRIKDVLREGEIAIPRDGIDEPCFRHDSGGDSERVLPGNKKFVVGDQIPVKGDGGRKDGKEAGEGDSTDLYRFVLSREEFFNIFFDDLELPDMAKKRLIESEEQSFHRAGYSTVGSPANMAIPRTVRQSLMRRLPQKWRQRKKRMAEIEAELLVCQDDERRKTLTEELAELKRKAQMMPFIDPVDVRFRNFSRQPKPSSKAVMFCLMDVSGSMSEHMKDLAKRFYMLLYIFLTRKYKQVEVVFIRHTDKAQEVDEETFFTDPASGGTFVSSALVEMCRVVKERYSPLDWNIYVAQASDGDNQSRDNERVAELMEEAILPIVQYAAYIEVAEEGAEAYEETSLWQTYRDLCSDGAAIAMRKVQHRREIWPVFHDLFQKRAEKESAYG